VTSVTVPVTSEVTGTVPVASHGAWALAGTGPGTGRPASLPGIRPVVPTVTTLTSESESSCGQWSAGARDSDRRDAALRLASPTRKYDESRV
jgi:hypothetical protein